MLHFETVNYIIILNTQTFVHWQKSHQLLLLMNKKKLLQQCKRVLLNTKSGPTVSDSVQSGFDLVFRHTAIVDLRTYVYGSFDEQKWS
jgi:hypothetical protein